MSPKKAEVKDNLLKGCIRTRGNDRDVFSILKVFLFNKNVVIIFILKKFGPGVQRPEKIRDSGSFTL